jgi:hypothetical protein
LTHNFLLKIRFNQKLPAVYKIKPTSIKKWNKLNLQDPVKLKQHTNILHKKWSHINKRQGINDNWKSIKTVITETASEIFQIQGKPTRNEWWDDDCRQAIQEKTNARIKTLQSKTRASHEVYREKRKMANKMCRNKKKKWLNDKIMQIEENHRKNEKRKFLEGIKNTRKQGINTPILVKGSDGNIISQIEQVLNRWREYFCETLNLSDSPVEQILIKEIINDNQEVDTLSYNEVGCIINNLKTNKAAGSDKIPPE